MKPLPTLTQMPWHILEMIVTETDTVSRLSLRKCSRQLRSIVDKSAMCFAAISVELNDNTISIVLIFHEIWRKRCLKRKQINYYPWQNGCFVGAGNREKLFKNESHISMAVADLATFIRSPHFHVNKLSFETSVDGSNSTQLQIDKDQFFSGLVGILDNLNRKLNVKELSFFDSETPLHVFLRVLSATEPRYLKHICVKLREGHEGLSVLTATEQWKEAKWLYMRADTYPFSKMGNFCSLYIESPTLSLKNVKVIIANCIDLGANFKEFHSDVKFKRFSAVCRYFRPYLKRYRRGVRWYSFKVPDIGKSLLAMIHRSLIVISFDNSD